ncbi:hypothetical protein VIGAN_03123700 [Vigna angularis var. angularis]|uniref:Uncharacterized protein n=1 Tax=Vigna angularis var. angularis TaxID=157739 RepID=A0A0S3RM69_PHAAN|nr:hypothetical protein VIGAN_03123700 [Vigna angularis var. angularis]
MEQAVLLRFIEAKEAVLSPLLFEGHQIGGLFHPYFWYFSNFTVSGFNKAVLDHLLGFHCHIHPLRIIYDMLCCDL